VIQTFAMTIPIIIALCVLLLIAYVFDLSSARTRIPSVILLILLGWLARQAAGMFEVALPDLTVLLPVFGTVGLILIVLEGSLELELNRSKINLVKKSLLMALLSIVALAVLLSFLFGWAGQGSFRINLINLLPLCIISSAIAIPSARNFGSHDREFIIYESSISDILGVLFFNFVLLHDNAGWTSIGHFGLQLVIIIIVSFVATVALAMLLNKIDHPIKFAPIILLVILIYAVSKIYHLPGLLFILLFGLFLGNLEELKQFKWIEKLRPNELHKEVLKFRDLTLEATFLVRSVFFLLFGYLIETKELLNADTVVWALAIVTIIFLVRALLLKILKLPISPLLFVAPRGLITILLFFAIEPQFQIPLVNKSLIVQIIIITAFAMMGGSVFAKKAAKSK
jgi:cell volume regulation protein A